MKKVLLAVVAVSLCAGSACADVLVAYFSRSGNTQTVAQFIAGAVSCDVFRITTLNAYPEDYDEMTALAREEQNNNARPELASHVEDMSRYDTVFLGYPIWWGTVPMCVYTFMEEYDFTGKRVIPFNTHGGSGLGRSITDIKAALTGANVDDGFAVRGTEAAGSQARITGWVKGLNITQPESPAPTVSEDIPSTPPAGNNNSQSSGSSSGGCSTLSLPLMLCTLILIRRKS